MYGLTKQIGDKDIILEEDEEEQYSDCELEICMIIINSW